MAKTYKNLKENISINKRGHDDVVVYLHHDETDAYAQELFDLYMKCGTFDVMKKDSSKDLVVGNIYDVTVIGPSGDGGIITETTGGQVVYLDHEKEIRFIEKYGLESKIDIGSKVSVLIESVHRGSFVGSLEKAYHRTLKSELLVQLKDQSMAYHVTVKSINDGGFIVDLYGMDCFVPGSLAAANKILDFKSMVGKSMYVMVEAYLESSDMFVLSNKKYIQRILPSKIKDLDFLGEYEGHVTGVLSYGCFVEWDEIFTGLLHESAATVDINKLSPGDSIKFYIKEVKDNNRIILTQKEPVGEHSLYQKFKNDFEGKDYAGATIKDIKQFGVFVEMEGVVGMLSPTAFKKRPQIGDSIDVHIKEVSVSSKRIYMNIITS